MLSLGLGAVNSKDQGLRWREAGFQGQVGKGGF